MSDLAVAYAALILHDGNVPATAENIIKVSKAANVTVEPFVAALFARMLETMPIESLLCNVGSGSAAAPTAAPAATSGAAAPAATAAKPAAKEETDEEEDTGFGLFD